LDLRENKVKRRWIKKIYIYLFNDDVSNSDYMVKFIR